MRSQLPLFLDGFLTLLDEAFDQVPPDLKQQLSDCIDLAGTKIEDMTKKVKTIARDIDGHTQDLDPEVRKKINEAFDDIASFLEGDSEDS